MKVRNLIAWAGDKFSYQPGDEIELDDKIAAARIEAGLAAPIEPAAPAGEDAPKSGKPGK
jgi:hypothetical protein